MGGGDARRSATPFTTVLGCLAAARAACRSTTARHYHELVGARAGQSTRDELRARGLALLNALAERVEARLGRINMGEVETLEVAHRKLAEHVVEDRGRILD